MNKLAPLPLPLMYAKLSPHTKRMTRERYGRLQGGLCYHCQAPLDGDPDPDIMDHRLNMRLFPPGFLDHPVHLHHDHHTGLTIGAVHARCNAVLFQFFGE